MKSIKFRKDESERILSGEQTVTWRLFDDKDLQEGEIVQFIVWGTYAEFAQARLTKIVEKKFEDLSETGWDGYKQFPSKERMYKTFEVFYNRTVDGQTPVKVIQFELINI